jgi:two-component system chemotaxis response regulator CheY
MPDSSYKDVNFLIVDDYPAVRIVLKKDLTEIGVKGKIFEANSATEAINNLQEILATDGIGFIISDWEMENGNGIDLLKVIRTLKQTQSIPFLMLSSVGRKEVVLNAVKEGVTDYLLKPWDQAQLTAKLENCWKKVNKS